MSFKLYYKGSGDTIYPMEFIPYSKGFKDDFDKVKKQAFHESFGRENTSQYSWFYPLGIITDAYFMAAELAKPTDDSLIEKFIERIGGSVDFSTDSNIKVTAAYNGKLYLDSECTKPSGISVFVKNSTVAFQFSEIDNNDYTIPPYSELMRCFDLFSIHPNNYNNMRLIGDSPTKYTDGFKKLSFRSPYSNADDTSLDKFLKNMYSGEQTVYSDDTNMAASPALSPFNISYLNSAIDDVLSAISMAHPSTMIGVQPSLCALYNNYATFYTVLKDNPIVAVDEMTLGGNKYRPAVVYRPDMFTAWDNLTYDVAHASSVKTYDIPSGYNQETIGDKNVWAVPLTFVQIGSGYLDSYADKTALNTFPYSNNNFSGAKIGDDDAKNAFMAINAGVSTISLPRYNFMLCQAYPVTNLSKYVYEIADNEVSRVRYEGSDNLVPYIFTIADVYWDNLSSWGNVLSNFDKPYNNSTACLAVIPLPEQFSNLTGQEMLDYFYGGKVSDWTPVEPVNPDIPSDGGNGGFNDSGQFGGNGTWSDSGVNTAVGGDPNTDPIYTMPDNLGLSGNYVIVKMSAQQLDELASTAWTEDGWLAHAAKTMGISRIGEGVLSVKTCFVDIPATGQVNVTAIAGYELPSPIGASSISQYTQFKFTPIPIPRFFGSFLDYAPYTEIVVELPFGQPAKIPPELVVGDSINITLRVDVMSETATYLITNSTKLIAQVPANVFVHLPFGSSEFTQSANSAAMSFISSAAGAVGSAVGAGNKAAQAAQGALPGMGGAAALEAAGGVGGLAAMAGSMVSGAAGVGQFMQQQNENRNITQISTGGGPGSIGAMQTKTPIVKISRPYVVIPTRYYDLNGAPSGVVRRIGDCKGYLEVGQIYGTIPCNAEEYQAVCSQLREGIFP